MHISATNAKNKFGQIMLTAQQESVFIERNGKVIAVMVSTQEYERLQILFKNSLSEAKK